MVKPEETIYLWNDEDLMNHSATKHLELLSRVTSLEEEAAELRAKLVAAAAAGSNVGSTEGYVRAGEEVPEPRSLTTRRAEMSAEQYAAAEVAAAEKIRQRLSEIDEERKALPPEEDVTEAIKGELPPADPEARPRSPSPSRKWKPLPPPPQPEPESEEQIDTDVATQLADGVGPAKEADSGWEQDDDRPETAHGIAQAVDRYFDTSNSGRQSPSFYTAEGELMVRLQTTSFHVCLALCAPRLLVALVSFSDSFLHVQPGLDATKERWKHELELEMLLASSEYREMLENLCVADTQHLTERIEAATRVGQGGGAAEAVWYIERAIAFKSEHPDVGFAEVGDDFLLPAQEEEEEEEREDKEETEAVGKNGSLAA